MVVAAKAATVKKMKLRAATVAVALMAAGLL
jgi:hypothetical protein